MRGLVGRMDLNMRNSRLERLGRYVRWRIHPIGVSGWASQKSSSSSQGSRDFSVVAQEYEVKREG